MRQPEAALGAGNHPSIVRTVAAFALAVACFGCHREPAAPTPAAPAPAPAAAVPTPAGPPRVPEGSRAIVPATAPAAPTDAASVASESTPDADAPSDDGSAWTGFLGAENDRAILALVCNATPTRLERNRGGSTLSFRARFGEHGKGLFKPQQRAEVANFRAELASYRLSALLGLHRVPPACGRSLARAELQRTADASGDPAFSERVMRELLGRSESVPGAMLYWVPGPLEPVPGVDRWAALLDPAVPLAPADQALAADLSRLLLFDFVTDNVDRWSGGNILRQHPARRAPSPMLFMDNGAAFSVGADGLGARPRDQAARLARVGRFPRRLLTALRTLDATSLTEVMRADPAGPLLSEAQVRAVLARRDRVVAHADELVRARGAAAVLVFP